MRYQCGIKWLSNAQQIVCYPTQSVTVRTHLSHMREVLCANGRRRPDTGPFCVLFVCLFLTQQPPAGQDLLIYEVSRLHTTTHHSQ